MNFQCLNKKKEFEPISARQQIEDRAAFDVCSKNNPANCKTNEENVAVSFHHKNFNHYSLDCTVHNFLAFYLA